MREPIDIILLKTVLWTTGIIREMTMRDNNRLNLSWLCETAGVSRSGYYSYLESEDLRQQREQHDREEFLRILEHSR